VGVLKNNTYPVIGAISLILYSILSFAEEVVEKTILARLFTSGISFDHDAFRLNTSGAKNILLALAFICIAVTIISLLLRKKAK
jgi:hypothetical protein